MKYQDQEFHGKIIVVDGDQFIGCDFYGCILQFCGGTVPVMHNVNFDKECRWEFVQAASNTTTFMRHLYHGGAKKLIENTFESIRKDAPKKEKKPGGFPDVPRDGLFGGRN